MTIFEDIIGKSADDRLAEEMLYAEAMREIEQGLRRDGLWGKALVEGGGDEKKARGCYLKLRVQALKDELEVERKKNIKENVEKNRSRNQGIIFFIVFWKKIIITIAIVLTSLLIADFFF
tara:strand:+ start:103 stop:462 length:360 start_codon:yes stop_codon:yes gene_type:complete